MQYILNFVFGGGGGGGGELVWVQEEGEGEGQIYTGNLCFRRCATSLGLLRHRLSNSGTSIKHFKFPWSFGKF